jgi:sugar O-acyltransferase (sialic acid O-acetyltransferase NeuD family)
MTPPVPIIVLGTGGNAREIVETLRDIDESPLVPERYECVGLLDDNEARWGQFVDGVPILGPLASAREFAHCRFVNGIGSPANFWKRAAIVASTGLDPDRFQTLVHPTATVARSAKLGRGVVLFQHVTVGVGAVLGDHAIVLPSSVVSHDCVVGAQTCIAAGVRISGDVRIDDACYLGSGASIRGGVRIGTGSLVGIGSVVLADVDPDTVVAGVPAKRLRSVRPVTEPAAAR